MLHCYINNKFDKNGHLFRGRYLAKIVQDEIYLNELCVYIHRNSIAAKMVCSLDEYAWSSHHAYLAKNKFQ